MECVVIVGNLATGILTVYGPFLDRQTAELWASTHVSDQQYTIHPIQR